MDAAAVAYHQRYLVNLNKLVDVLEAVKVDIDSAVVKYNGTDEELNSLLATLSAGIYGVALVLETLIIQVIEKD